MKKLFAVILMPAAVFAQGNLTPPGAPSPTMKTLQQVEPRTPISSLPYTINQPGSYYLTTNLTGATERHGIIVNADGVTIDLNGFEVVGTSSAGVVSAIHVTPSRTNIIVRNGTLRRWQGYGVNADTSSGRFEKLHFLDIEARGILAPYAIVSDCRFEKVGFGITVGSRSTIKNCVIVNATFDGINTSEGCMILDSVIEACGGYGIYAGNGSIVRSCKVYACGHSGIGASGVHVGSDSTLESTTSLNSGRAGFEIADDGAILRNCIAANNGEEGIWISKGASLIEGCTVRANREVGIRAGRDTTILACTVSTNTGHGILGTTNLVIKNCVVSRNAGNGIQVDDNSTIAHCTSSLNSSNGIDVTLGCTITENTTNENGRNGIVANARCRVFGNTANNNGSFMTSGAGFYILGDDNHIEGNNSVHNYIGYLIDGAFNLIIKNKATDYFNGGFSLDTATNREAPIVGDPTGAEPWANFAY